MTAEGEIIVGETDALILTLLSARRHLASITFVRRQASAPV